MRQLYLTRYFKARRNQIHKAYIAFFDPKIYEIQYNVNQLAWHYPAAVASRGLIQPGPKRYKL